MSTNEQARVTHEDARKALDSMDDYARMEMGVDAYGPRGVLERYIAQQSSAPAGGVSDALEQRAMLAWSGYWCDCNDANVAGNNRDAMRAALESTLSAPEPAAQGEVGVGVDVTSDGMHVCVRLGDTIVYSQFHPAPPAHPAERVPEGMVLVPRELTAEMSAAFWALFGEAGWLYKGWAAMLAASPAPSESESEGGKGVDRG